MTDEQKAALLCEILQRKKDPYNTMQQCPAICLIVIRWSDHALRSIPEQFWENETFCREAVKSNTDAMFYIPPPLLTDEFILAAVRENGMILEYIPRMRLTKEIVITAVKSRRNALALVSDEWREEAKAALEEK